MSRKRKASRRKIKSSSWLSLFCLAILICVSLAATIYLIFLRPGTITQSGKLENTPPEISKIQEKPKKELIKADTAEPPNLEAEPEIVKESDVQKYLEATVAATAPITDSKIAGPRVAIIIDDMGYRQKVADKLISLDLNLSFSFLPHSTHGQKLAEKAKDLGRDVLLHLPMEPTDKKWNPGPGALFLEMDKDTTSRVVAENLATVPLAIGVNNHMGSLYSENETAMKVFLAEIKPKNLFFIDSLTSSKSVGYKLAEQMGIVTGKRDIFLDNDKDTPTIIKQIERLVAMAIKHGKAIGIAHPYSTTLKALEESRIMLTQQVTMVAVHELLN